MKIHFITFSGKYNEQNRLSYKIINRNITFLKDFKSINKAKERILLQAKKTNIFSSVYGYDNFDLQADVDFYLQHKSFIQNNTRGYGYWLWKPYIIYKKLKNLPIGDVLLYADAGANINTELNSKQNEKNKMFLYNHAKKHIISTVRHRQDILKQWIKNDVILKYETSIEFLNTRIVEANRILIYNNITSQEFIKKWYDMCCQYKDLDDSESRTISPFNFIEHRHDQSLLNCLIDIEAHKGNIFKIKNIFNNDHSSINCCKLRNIIEVYRWPLHLTGKSYFCKDTDYCKCGCCVA